MRSGEFRLFESVGCLQLFAFCWHCCNVLQHLSKFVAVIAVTARLKFVRQGRVYIYNPVTYWPSTLFKIKLRLVAVDLGQVTGFGFGSHVGMGLRSNSGLVVSRTPSCHNHKHGAS